jgi:GDP-fucose transporter C1
LINLEFEQPYASKMTEKSGYKEIEFDDKDQTKVKRIDDSFSPTTFTILIVVAFYWICSLSVVFLNKYILSSSESKFPFPLLVTWFQLIVALVLLIVFGFLGKSIKMFSMVTPYEMKLELARKIVPLSIVYVMMLAMNNICLQYVEVTFYQVARSLTIVFQLLFTVSLMIIIFSIFF